MMLSYKGVVILLECLQYKTLCSRIVEESCSLMLRKVVLWQTDIGSKVGKVGVRDTVVHI